MYNEHDDNMPALQTIDEKEEVNSDGEDDNDDEEEEDPLEALEMRKGSSCCRTQMQFTHHCIRCVHAIPIISLELMYIYWLAQVCKLSFAIVHSTTIALPTWCDACAAHSLHAQLIPHNVKTWGDSTYDMLKIALEYCEAVDITANKSVKLHKYELDDEDWEIVKNLLQVLKVKFAQLFINFVLYWLCIRCIKMWQLPFSFLKTMLQQLLMSFQPWTKLMQCWAVLQLNHFLLLSNRPSSLHRKSWTNTTRKQTYLVSIRLWWVCLLMVLVLSSPIIDYPVLHPQLKLKYFQQHGWPKTLVNTVEDMVREEFTNYNIPRETACTSECCLLLFLLFLLTSLMFQ